MKDRQPQRNKANLDGNTPEGSDAKIAPTGDFQVIKIQKKNPEPKKEPHQFKSKPDVLTERMDSSNPEKDKQTSNMFFNIKSFMLNKIMDHPVKKNISNNKFNRDNQFKMKTKPQSKQNGANKEIVKMPVFPNFPQKGANQRENTYLFHHAQPSVTETNIDQKKKCSQFVHRWFFYWNAQ